MRRLTNTKNMVTTWREIEKRNFDLNEMITLASEENDYSIQSSIARDIVLLQSELENLEITLILNNEYDPRDAILALHAGAGGTESQDWADNTGYFSR
jgi:peptide chain release factor 2